MAPLENDYEQANAVGGQVKVSGAGRVHLVTRSLTGVNVQTLTSGQEFPIAELQ